MTNKTNTKNNKRLDTTLNVETLIKRINAVGKKQSKQLTNLKTINLKDEPSFISLKQYISNNFESILKNVSLQDFKQKFHKNSLVPYEFIFLSCLDSDQLKQMVIKSEQKPIVERNSTNVTLRVRLVRNSKQGRRLPLVCNDGFYQLVNDSNKVLRESLCFNLLNRFMSENNLIIKDISFHDKNVSSRLVDTHFIDSDLTEVVEE